MMFFPGVVSCMSHCVVIFIIRTEICGRDEVFKIMLWVRKSQPLFPVPIDLNENISIVFSFIVVVIFGIGNGKSAYSIKF